MCIGPDDGCHDVPDPIAPIDMRFLSLDPTRIAMSLSLITINGPIFIDPMPGILPMPGMFCIPPGDGLAPGICLCIPDMFIPGMFMSGMFAMLCLLALGFFLVVVLFFCPLLPIFIPGMFCMFC